MDTLIRKIELPKITDPRGSLSFLESNNHVPFSIKSTYIMTNISLVAQVNELIVNEAQEFLVVVSGFLDIRIKSREVEELFILNKPNEGLYIPANVEKCFMNISPKIILLVLRG